MSKPKIDSEGTACGDGAGVIKKSVEEMLKKNPDISETAVAQFLSSLSEASASKVGSLLMSGKLSEVADACREHFVRMLVQGKLQEVVRKKPGGGGYVLYSPNQGKKKTPKPSGTFPTKLGAKRAELSRFPPRDPGKLARARKALEKLMKDPKKRAAAERRDKEEKPRKKESAAVLPDGSGFFTATIGESRINESLRFTLLKESLFQEEATGSEWDERLSKLSKKALSGDKTLQKLQGNIEKRTESVLNDAFKAITKATKGVAKLKSLGIKHSPDKGKTYMGFEAELGDQKVGPFFLHSEHGIPRIEVSTEAKTAMMQADPAAVKALRAELVTVQERVLDRVEDLVKAIANRDKYLTKVEDEVDGFVAGLSPLQVSVLKNLLVQKYRKQ